MSKSRSKFSSDYKVIRCTAYKLDMRCLDDPTVHLMRLLDIQPLGTGLDVADLSHH